MIYFAAYHPLFLVGCFILVYFLHKFLPFLWIFFIKKMVKKAVRQKLINLVYPHGACR